MIEIGYQSEIESKIIKRFINHWHRCDRIQWQGLLNLVVLSRRQPGSNNNQQYGTIFGGVSGLNLKLTGSCMDHRISLTTDTIANQMNRRFD